MKMNDFEVECKSLFWADVEAALKSVLDFGSRIDTSRVDIVPNCITEINVRGSKYNLEANVIATEQPSGTYLLKLSNVKFTRVRSRI